MKAKALVSGRGILLTLLALVLIAAMVWLGKWQLDVYDRHQHDDAAAALQGAPVPLDELLGPDDAFPPDAVGRPVTTTGEYSGADQFYVRGLDGASGRYAVVTPLVTESGSAILVVRGSTDSADPSGPAPPDGTVEVTGVLEPSQTDGDALDADRVTNGIRISSLVSSFSTDVYAGYVVATTTSPPDQLSPVSPPVGEPSRWAGIRNLIYAMQWWIFAGFVAFMWWRILSDQEDEPVER